MDYNPTFQKHTQLLLALLWHDVVRCCCEGLAGFAHATMGKLDGLRIQTKLIHVLMFSLKL